MVRSVRFRFLLALVAVSAAIHTPAYAENWISLENGQVDRDSFRREGTWVFYRMRNGPIWPHSDYRVDCSQVGASEVVTETWTDGSWREFRLPSNSIGADIARYVCSAV